MPTNLPVDFEERAKRPKGTTNADYPYAIKARDLMEDFVFATLDLDQTLFEETTGQGGHKQRRLKIPAVPNEGAYVLEARNGAIDWSGGTVREYLVVINGTLYKEGFQCATEDASGNEYPIEVT